MNKTLKRFLIGMAIVFVTMIVVTILGPIMPFVPNEVWEAVEVSFGLAYIMFSPKDFNLDKKVGFMIYLLVSIFFILIGTGLNYLF